MKKSLDTKIEVKNYPYGRLRTSMFFSVEFDKKRGFRSVQQTINPKTGRLNNPKKSTYHDVLILDQADDGFCKYQSLEFYHIEKFPQVLQSLSENYDLFSEEMHKYLFARIVSFFRLETIALVTYCGADQKTVLEILKPGIDVAIQGFKTGENLFANIKIDYELLNATKVEGFSPFKTR